MNTSSNDCDQTPEHPGLDPVVADILLEKLSTDDAFRERFQENPGNALASLGVAEAQALIDHAPKPGDLFYCMTTHSLASKEEIAFAREQLAKHLSQRGNHNVIFCFEADRIASALDRS
ncbi:NHLP-related RiPP peptide [Stenotrophomonas sp. LARHCG68]